MIHRRPSIVGENNPNFKHGKTSWNEHKIWVQIRGRCLNKKDKLYKYYGGRGITVCARWDNFENFIKDVGRRPSLLHSIDRIDNSKGYKPSNVKWATKKEQASNRRTNILISMEGRTQTLMQWCEEKGIAYDLAHSRRRHGWDMKDVFRTEKWAKYKGKRNDIRQ